MQEQYNEQYNEQEDKEVICVLEEGSIEDIEFSENVSLMCGINNGHLIR